MKNLFGGGFINLGIRGDHVENVPWRAIDIAFPPQLNNVVMLCGVNNINKDTSPPRNCPMTDCQWFIFHKVFP